MTTFVKSNTEAPPPDPKTPAHPTPKQLEREAERGYRGTPPGGHPREKETPGDWMPYGRLPYEMLDEIDS